MSYKKKILILLSISIVFLPFAVYFFMEDISLDHPYETTYLDQEEKEITTLIHDRPAQYIEYNDIPKNFIDYLLAIEDASFFTHSGFDVGRIFSSFFHNIFSDNSLQGASTITMQLARLLYLNQERTLKRKIQEFFLAQKLENTLSKEKILEYYLNSVYFAHGIYGVGTASNYYFGKNLKELTIYEMAMLIGIINAPNLYSPFINLEASKEKTSQILKNLVTKKVLSVKDYYASFEDNVHLEDQKEGITPIESYYLDAVQEEMASLNCVKEAQLRHGITITTYLNSTLQKKVEKIIQSFSLGKNDVACCIMEVNSGKVLALIGGKDYKLSSFNRALHSKKQIGSTIKPLLYYLALLKGFSPLTELTSEKTTFHIENYGDYPVSNAGDIYAHRKITMLEAVAMSDNIYAMKTMLYIGSENLKHLLEQFQMNVDVENPTLALGSNSLTPLELTSIYNTIASGGLFYKPHFIKSIKYADSYLLYQANSKQNKRIFSRIENDILRYMLRAPFDQGLKSYGTPSLLNYYISPRYAGKTGSTESSSWVMGFSPEYTIGVYVGTDDNSKMEDASLSRKIFYEIAKYLDNKDLDFFLPNENLNVFCLYNTLSKKSSLPYLKRS